MRHSRWRFPAGQARPLSALVVQRNELAPPLWEIVSLGILSVTAATLFFNGGHEAVNVAGPIALAAILGMANWQLARRFPAAIWTPLFGYRTAALVYFGFGGFLPLIYDPYTMDYALALYGFSAEEAAKVNLIWITASALLIAGARAFAFFGPAVTVTPPSGRSDRTLSMGMIFFALGFGGYLLVALPSLLGTIGILIPGSVLTLLEVLNAGGIFLIALWGFSRGPKGYAVVALVFVASTVLGLIALTKAMIVLPQLLICLAYLMQGPTLRRVAVISATLLITFALLVPIVSHGREMHSQKYGQLGGGTIIERIGYTGSWLRGEQVWAREVGETVNPLSRLSYFNVATYAVNRYDVGQPSDSIENALIAIVPRVIWPDKPFTTSMNADLYYELTGREGTAVTTTVPPDIYWNFGWAGILLLCPLLGLPLMFATARCYQIVAERDWLMMPFVLLCFRVTLAVDSQFVNAIFAPAVMAAVLYVGLRFTSALLQRSRRQWRAAPALRLG